MLVAADGGAESDDGHCVDPKSVFGSQNQSLVEKILNIG